MVEYIGPELALDYSNWGRGGTDLGDQIVFWPKSYEIVCDSS